MKLAKVWPEGPLVLGHDTEIGEFVARRIKHMHGAKFVNFTTMGIIRRGELIGGIIFHDHQPEYKSVVVSYAFDRPSWASPSVLASISQYVFVQLGCQRMATYTPRKNKRSRKFVEGVGFKLEGCARKALGTDDAMVYGMLRNECRWLIEDK